jgi:hypothetical protein
LEFNKQIRRRRLARWSSVTLHELRETEINPKIKRFMGKLNSECYRISIANTTVFSAINPSS